MTQICLSHTDIAVCNANLDAGVVDQGGRDCMAKKATLSCAKTKRSRHKQDTRHQPLSVLQYLLRLIGKHGGLLKKNTWLPRVHRGNRLTPKLDQRKTASHFTAVCDPSSRPCSGDMIKRSNRKSGNGVPMGGQVNSSPVCEPCICGPLSPERK